MKTFFLHIFSIVVAMLIPACAVDYTFKNGNKIRVEATPEAIAILQDLEQGRGYRK